MLIIDTRRFEKQMVIVLSVLYESTKRSVALSLYLTEAQTYSIKGTILETEAIVG